MLPAVATAVLGLSAPTLLPRHHAPAVCALPRPTFCAVGRALPVVMNTEDAPGAASFDPDEAIGKQSASSEQSKKKLSAKQVENTKAYFVNQKLEKARDTETILKLSTDEDLTPVNVATALHVLAKINKVRRAGRDALLRDSRYEALLDLVVADAEKFGARSVADVLWSCATLRHWPPLLLKPLLLRVVYHLER